MFFFINGEFEFIGQYIGQLFMWMVMYWVNCVLGEIYFNCYYFIVMGQDLMGYVVIQIVKCGFVVENKYVFFCYKMKYCFI